MVALEAMAAGKCVLATPVGGFPNFSPVRPTVWFLLIKLSGGSLGSLVE